MTDYESGTAAWDIGAILTRHRGIPLENPCARVRTLRVERQWSPEVRLRAALATKCTCGAGDSSAERTSLLKESV